MPDTTFSTLDPVDLAHTADTKTDELIAVRVVAVDSRRERRHLMRLLLERSFRPEEIAEADSQSEAVLLVERLRPGLVVLEIQMPLEEGLDTISALRRLTPPPRIVVCSFLREPAAIQAAMERGADEYVTKPVSAFDLGAKLRLATTG